jgi:Fe-S-cluster containining protein
VLATIPEFLRLLRHVRSTFSENDRDALRARTERYASQLRGRSFDEAVDEVVPCPLLVDGRCAAYDVRPLVCRGYNSTNVAACQAASTDASATVPIFAVLKDVTDGTTVGVAQALEEEGLNAALVDLGTALHIALHASGCDDLTDVLSGASALAPAENHSLVADLWAAVKATAAEHTPSRR